MLKPTLIATLMILAATGSVPAATNRTVRFQTPDGVGIAATYTSVERAPAPAVVLVHGLSESRGVWTNFAGLLASNGIASLAIDLRGYGDSVRRATAAGTIYLDYREFRAIDFHDMLLDVNSAVDWLLEQPGVDPHRIGIVGASIGGNIVLRYAVVNTDLAAIVALSPGLVYKEVRTDDVIGKIPNHPLRLLVAQDDAFAFESCKRLMEIRKELQDASSQTEMKACAGNAHGTDLVRRVDGLAEWLTNWLKQTLSATK
jgi:dienelactone hydrolase